VSNDAINEPTRSKTTALQIPVARSVAAAARRHASGSDAESTEKITLLVRSVGQMLGMCRTANVKATPSSVAQSVFSSDIVSILETTCLASERSVARGEMIFPELQIC
jgi:hypothetical protein